MINCILSKWADKQHHFMEQQVLQNADCVVTVSNSWAKDFIELGRKEVEVITNGFDEADFPNESVELFSGFVLHHIGSMNKDRNPHVLWKVLKELCATNSDFKNDLKIMLTGKNDFAVIESIKENGLFSHLELIEYMPRLKL
ncbi:MAG: hypothetical protein IPL48_16000 [Bacteroidetes bacterium]|nr:hypothetical protein [Bacteroidota bacterium]